MLDGGVGGQWHRCVRSRERCCDVADGTQHHAIKHSRSNAQLLQHSTYTVFPSWEFEAEGLRLKV